jgi:hypothetical protein
MTTEMDPDVVIPLGSLLKHQKQSSESYLLGGLKNLKPENKTFLPKLKNKSQQNIEQ